MKRPLTHLTLASWLAATPLHASITMSFDVLDGADPGAPSPPGLVVVDLAVQVSQDDAFHAAGIFALTSNGANFRYTPTGNPDFPNRFTPPGDGDHYVSFGSYTYGREDPARFAPAYTPEEPGIALFGGWYPDDPTAELLPHELNISYFATPSTAPPGRSGFVMRVALDVAGVTIPGADAPENYRIFTPGSEPAGYLPVLISQAPSPWIGTKVYARRGGSDGFGWGLYVPEPTSATLLLMAALVLSRRRN